MTARKGRAPKSSIYQRRGSPYWWIRRTVAGIGEIRISTRTSNEKLARRYDDLVCELRELGRFDALRALKAGGVSLHDLHTHREPVRLAELLTRTAAPLVRPLVEEWLKRGADDTGVRDSTMRRYAASWKHVWEVLPDGARVSDLDQRFVSEFKRHRYEPSENSDRIISPATLNRDLAAIGAFLSWCAQEKGLAVMRPKLKYQGESKGKTRWLKTKELAVFRDNCPSDWWPLFGLLFGTGMTISEALGLRVCAIDLKDGLVSLHEEHGRKLKRAQRARELVVPHALLPALSTHIDGSAMSPMDRVFPFTYWPARKVWGRVCEAAAIVGATIHDARHTFAVHAVMNGVPEARLQKLLGHSHPGTTRRYASFAPGEYVKEDGEAVAASLGLNVPALRLERGA
jgi:integrase